MDERLIHLPRMACVTRLQAYTVHVRLELLAKRSAVHASVCGIDMP